MEMTMPTEAKLYKTTDLYLAAALMCADVPFKGTEKEPNGTRTRFLFLDEAQLVPAIRDEFFARKCKVDALTYADRVRTLKSLCHNN